MVPSKDRCVPDEAKPSPGCHWCECIPSSVEEGLNSIGGIKELGSHLPAADELERMAGLNQALSDPARIRIMLLLHKIPLCVCLIKEFIDMADSKLSYHLRILKVAGLIVGERKGNWIIYCLTDEGSSAVDRMLK